MSYRAIFVLFWILVSIGHSRGETSDFLCGTLQNAYGPYDYRSDKDKISIVEGAHLTSNVVNLVKGSSGALGADIDYTLRAIPNHPVALLAMVRLGAKEKTAKPWGAHYTVECYFHRANRFRSDDSMVKMIYATYLAKNGQPAEALKFLNEAVELGVETANLYYNIGLVYLDLKQYDKALKNAHRAYQMGFPLPGLRDRLKREGKWSEVPPVVELESGQKSEEKAASDLLSEKPVEGVSP